MREYVLVFLVAAVVTYLLTVVAREFALRTHAVAEVRDRDVHDEPIPYLGGLAMMGGLVAAYLVGRELPFLGRADPYIFDQARAVLIAGAVICTVGVSTTSSTSTRSPSSAGSAWPRGSWSGRACSTPTCPSPAGACCPSTSPRAPC